MREASEPSLKGVLSQLLNALIDQRVTHLAQGAQLIKALNMIAVKLIDGGEPTAVMVALMKLLRETLQSPTANNKFTELVMKVRFRSFLSIFLNDVVCSAYGNNVVESKVSPTNCVLELCCRRRTSSCKRSPWHRGSSARVTHHYAL